MVTSAIVILGVLLTLVLPIYPQGFEPSIGLFLVLAGLGGMMGLMRRAARRELMVLSPWVVALMLAMLVGGMRQGESRQALEDCLPYLLFMIGLVAGRGAARPRTILVAVLVACLGDSLVSLYKMPSFEPGIRSTYNYFKITAGLPLVGVFASTLLRHTDSNGRSPSLATRPGHLVAYGLMLVALFASVSRGMMLGYVIGLLFTAYIRRPSQVLMASLVVSVGLLAFSSVFLELGEKYLRLRSSGTIEGRVDEIESAWATFLQYPLLGAGLGATFVVDGAHKAYVHNMAAYHLWKFGLVGSGILAMPLFVIGRQLSASGRDERAIAIGGGLSVIAYLITCAAYKTYYLVWILGVVVGATISWLTAWRTMQAPQAPVS
ncbi:O-antigen ligase family protein [Paraliomyxa miuraensis]|uniref:O-antigen ligase family protein n=1 Tax=Paraliomyxa miuraensis TaxID=376150 RepID=UPI00225106A5|nr:O-antigen ligase family protein [Paraliomyxa miuraensis]MCX4247883.1 O-antigen ligase family protein [Paraliomyxa miuraensis]